MPAGKRQQSSAMLYTVVVFVALFIIAAVLAVIFYVKFEEQLEASRDAKAELADIASPAEQSKKGAIVGSKEGGKSYLGTTLGYLDEAVNKAIGVLPADTSAQVKIDRLRADVNEKFAELAEKDMLGGTEDANSSSLLGTIEAMELKLDTTREQLAQTEARLLELNNLFDDTVAEGKAKEDALLAEKSAYQEQIDQMTSDYEELKTLLEQTTEDRVTNLMTRLEEAREEQRQQRQDMLKQQAELDIVTKKMESTQGELQKMVPQPDASVAAFKPDAMIMMVDRQLDIVHINLGSNDRVYVGLTFSVYDKNMPIPRDGKGKAEIEVFKVGETICSARILESSVKNPIVENDFVANLIWDKDKVNSFVIAGEFDLEGDGELDYKAVEKLGGLVTKWGGVLTDSVQVSTDYIVLGEAPVVPKEPTFEDLEVDPLAMDRYDEAVAANEYYGQVMEQAKKFSIPVFNLDRFLYFIGYKTQAAKTGAF